jgi:catechol 2,3-dioxygenase-like lactoylglutathione lyase family enzyme
MFDADSQKQIDNLRPPERIHRRGFIRGLAVGAGTATLASLIPGMEASAHAASSPSQSRLMKGLNSLHHIGITVPDIQQAYRFYCDALGFEKVMEVEWDESRPETNKGGLTPEMIEQLKRVHQIDPSVKTAATVAMVQASNLILEFWAYRNPKVVPQDPNRSTHHSGFMHMAFDVSNLDELYPRLLAAGVRFHVPPQRSGAVNTTYGRDPFGNIIEFQELPKESFVPNAPA